MRVCRIASHASGRIRYIIKRGNILLSIPRWWSRHWRALVHSVQYDGWPLNYNSPRDFLSSKNVSTKHDKPTWPSRTIDAFESWYSERTGPRTASIMSVVEWFLAAIVCRVFWRHSSRMGVQRSEVREDSPWDAASCRRANGVQRYRAVRLWYVFGE